MNVEQLVRPECDPVLARTAIQHPQDGVPLGVAGVSNPAAVTMRVDKIEQAFGGVDALVNNAGSMMLSPIAQTDDAAFDQHVAVNLTGVFNGLREGSRRIREGGRIVDFSSSVVGL